MADLGIGIITGSTKHSPVVAPLTHHVALESLPKPSFASPASISSHFYAQHSSSLIDCPAEQQELHAHIEKQADAMRMQHDAFIAERDCWNMERTRLNRRIAALEALLKSSNAQSPAGSPQFAPYQQGQAFSVLPSNPRASSAGAPHRLPSIAEDAAPAPQTKTSIRRDSAPSRIDLSHATTFYNFDGQADSRPDTKNTRFVADIHHLSSPDYMLSPPPAANIQHAGHTPSKTPTRPILDGSPTLSHKSLLELDPVTESNTESNKQDFNDDNDIALRGPLRLPALPNVAGPDDFTMDMLTMKLNKIKDNPDDNSPAAFRAISNNDDDNTSIATGDDRSQSLTDTPNHDEATPQKTDKTPRPTPTDAAAPDVDEDQDLQHGGIKLKKKPSCNFGAPLGQLGPKDQSYKKF